MSAVGLVFGSLTPPERIPRAAARAEDLGFDELWFSEDCFFSGGMSGAAALLAATRRIPVGTGIVSLMSRHPAVTAMEFAGLARSHPGRLRPGVGLGVRAWLTQMGVMPAAPLTALDDGVGILRALLAGEEVTFHGTAHHLDGVRLDFPPGERLPIQIGAVNEKALRLSGRVADGTILSVLASPAYVRWARDVLTRAAADAGRRADTPHRLTTYVLYAVDSDPERARRAVRPAVEMFLRAEATSSLVRVPGFDAELAALLAAGPEVPLAPRITDAWLDRFAVAGTPEQCAERLNDLLDAGSDAVALWPLPTDRADDVVELTAREVLPRLRR